MSIKIQNITTGKAYWFRNTLRIDMDKKYNIVNLSIPGTIDTKEGEQTSSVLTAILGIGKELPVSFAVTKRAITDIDADYTFNTGTGTGHPKYTSIMDEIEWLEDFVFLGSNKLYLLDINGRQYSGTVDDFHYSLDGETCHSYILCSFVLKIGAKIS